MLSQDNTSLLTSSIRIYSFIKILQYLTLALSCHPTIREAGGIRVTRWWMNTGNAAVDGITVDGITGSRVSRLRRVEKMNPMNPVATV